jgi:hypothetical protein
VVNDQVYELDLICVQRLSGEESGERLLGGLAIQSHQ